MRNVEISVKGNVLTAKIDLSKDGVMSGTGKTINIATTGKPCHVEGMPDDMRIGMNVFKYPPRDSNGF